MHFVTIEKILSGSYVNKRVAIRGWLYRQREGKETIFLIVRDSTGFIQCTVKKESPAWNKAKKITIESSLTLEGIARQDKRAPGGYEISVEKL